MNELFARIDETPVSKNRTVLKMVRGMQVFLKPKARFARDGTPVPGRTNARIRKLRRLWRRAANKGRGLAVKARGQTSGEGGIRAENVVWIFGSGRTGSTWLGSIMGEIKGQTVWREPLVGTLFGNLYY